MPRSNTDAILSPTWPDLRGAMDRHAPAACHGDAPLDAQRLVDRCMGNLAFATRILRKFADRFGEDFQELESYVEQTDPTAVARIAHRLKGTSANASALQLQQIAAELEQSAQAERWSEIEAHVEQLSQAWNEFVEFMAPASPSSPQTT